MEMTWEQANEEWDNGKLSLAGLRAVALNQLAGDELNGALEDIAMLERHESKWTTGADK